ncbi:hypothetical protein [Brevundimonas sp.]|uniref:hypothetical protein n=1 Tax=Brevundimonas sp. TaxID=1871086 RepID=UPI001A2C1E77|nr:hypothetical protein [Brevundimonas sp.]MBJ7484364.1 hypothetical protein [Brevundimonas sp.]
MGEVTEAQINARTDLQDGDKAALTTSIRAQARRVQADVARDAALERANASSTWSAIRDEANAGTLTNSDIADYLNAGTITAGQAATARRMRDRGLAPVIQNVLAPVRDDRRARQSSQRGNAVPLATAEFHAANWAAANPNATLEQQLAFGKVVADTVYGASGAGRPAGDAAAARARSSQVARANAAIAARRASGRPYSTAEANRLRNEAIHGPVH